MKENLKKKKLDQGKRMFLYMLPFLLLCFAFSYFPLHGWIYSFYDYKPPLKLSQCNFMGLRWFKMIFGNPAQVRQLFIVMRNTFAMSFLNIATSVLPLFFAVFLNEIKCKWFRKMMQTLTTIPNFISWVLVYAVGLLSVFQYRYDQYSFPKSGSDLKTDQIHGHVIPTPVSPCYCGVPGKVLAGALSCIWLPLRELIRRCMRQPV